MPPSLYRFQTGQSIAEYCLALGLIAGLSFLGLFGLGQALNGTFGALLPGPGAKMAQASSGKSALGKTGLNALPGKRLSHATTHGLMDSAQFAASIETIGANGTTKLLAATLKSHAQQWLEAGKIDEMQAALISKLSDAGVEIATVQALLESNSGYSEPGGKMSNTFVAYKGETLNLVDLAAKIGTDGDLPGGSLDQNLLLNPSYAGGEVSKSFASIYQQALSDSRLMEDPEINGVVTALSQQIMFSSELSEDYVENYSRGKIDGTDNQFFQSYATQVNAGAICDVSKAGNEKGDCES